MYICGIKINIMREVKISYINSCGNRIEGEGKFHEWVKIKEELKGIIENSNGEIQLIDYKRFKFI